MEHGQDAVEWLEQISGLGVGGPQFLAGHGVLCCSLLGSAKSG